MNALDQWRAEIESLSGGLVVLVRVETDQAENVLRIPPDFPGRPVLRRFLLDEPFVAQLIRAHALSVNSSAPEGVFHFVLLNMARAGDWEGREEELLAHEYGHIWLNALGYRSLPYDATRVGACLATHSSDIVQHILIRQETHRRGFDSTSFWAANQERWLKETEAAGTTPSLDPCQRLQLVSAWLDAVMGMTPEQWEHLPRYLAVLRSSFPSLAPAAGKLERLLRDLNLGDRSLYEAALAGTRDILRAVVPSL